MPDLIEKVSMLDLFFNKSPVIRVLNSYKTPIIRTEEAYMAQTSCFYIFNIKVGWDLGLMFINKNDLQDHQI